MQLENIGPQLSKIVENSINSERKIWLREKVALIIQQKSTKELYLTYSLIASKIKKEDGLKISEANTLKNYIETQNGNIHQITRIYLLVAVLDADEDFFTSKVANIIQVADTSELETFLKFLIWLPNADAYKMVAVEALRTNISIVFNAIALNNPYPAMYFDEQQWNQMYLKTAFMQGDLSAILAIDKRANKDLARIISDYAHERWAAGRDIDPDFWRPVTKFISADLLEDMERLLKSKNRIENRAGALCCYYSENQDAINLLSGHQKLIQQIEDKDLNWQTLKEE